MFPGTISVIMVTCAVSLLAFQRRDLVNRLIFSPERILANKEYYRLVTSSLLHANGAHLFWNMFSVFLFGRNVEAALGTPAFFCIYLGAIIGGDLLSLYLHRHHEYSALGASGGACGIVFACVLLAPGMRIYLYFIPLGIPGWLYALGYLGWTFWRMKEGRDNIGHDAHLGGGIIGLLIAAAFSPVSVREHWEFFVAMIAVAGGMLLYLWKNPLFLPLSSFWQPGRGGWRSSSPSKPSRRPERLRVDEILEKINQQGINSLTPDERALLDEVSGKYRRRSESKKPDSDLII